MKFGFLIGEREFIPELFAEFSKEEIAEFFIVLFNSYVENGLKIPLSYAKTSSNLEQIFRKRIDDLLGISSVIWTKNSPKNAKKRAKNHKNLLFCSSSMSAIDAYQTSSKKILLKYPKLNAAKLITTVYLKSEPGLVFCADELFKNFVFSRIFRLHKDKGLTFKDGVITLQKGGKKTLSVMPFFEKFDLKILRSKIEKALSLSSEDREFYIVLPRQSGLCRHVEIKSCSILNGEKCIKIVPYKLTSKIIKRIQR